LEIEQVLLTTASTQVNFPIASDQPAPHASVAQHVIGRVCKGRAEDHLCDVMTHQ
jgi:hypothetical protein